MTEWSSVRRVRGAGTSREADDPAALVGGGGDVDDEVFGHGTEDPSLGRGRWRWGTTDRRRRAATKIKNQT